MVSPLLLQKLQTSYSIFWPNNLNPYKYRNFFEHKGRCNLGAYFILRALEVYYLFHCDKLKFMHHCNRNINQFSASLLSRFRIIFRL